MMRVQVQSFSVPRWVVPVVILIALALIPFALILGLALTALAVGFTVLRAFLPSPQQPFINQNPGITPGLRVPPSASPVIDADYEIKDENGEK